MVFHSCVCMFQRQEPCQFSTVCSWWMRLDIPLPTSYVLPDCCLGSHGECVAAWGACFKLFSPNWRHWFMAGGDGTIIKQWDQFAKREESGWNKCLEKHSPFKDILWDASQHPSYDHSSFINLSLISSKALTFQKAEWFSVDIRLSQEN